MYTCALCSRNGDSRSTYIATCWLGRWWCGGGVLHAVRVAVTQPAVGKAVVSIGELIQLLLKATTQKW
jgi:hypothetical protein